TPANGHSGWEANAGPVGSGADGPGEVLAPALGDGVLGLGVLDEGACGCGAGGEADGAVVPAFRLSDRTTSAVMAEAASTATTASTTVISSLGSRRIRPGSAGGCWVN